MRMGRLGGSVLVACSAAALVSGCDLILGVTDPPVPADGAVDAGRDGARSKDGASAGRDATVDGNGRPDAGQRQDGAQGHPDGAAGGDAPHHDATGDATPSVDATKDGTAPSDAARDGTSADAATDASDAGLPPACDAAADPFGSADAGPLVTFTPAGVGHIADIASADGTTFVWADDGTNTVNELQPGGGTLQLAAATGYAPGSVTVSTNGDVVWSRGEGAHLTFMQATLGLPLSGTSMTGPSVGAVVHGFVFDDAGARAYADLYAPDAGLSGLYCFPFAQTGVIPSCSHSGLYPTQNAGMASDGGSVSVALGPGAARSSRMRRAASSWRSRRSRRWGRVSGSTHALCRRPASRSAPRSSRRTAPTSTGLPARRGRSIERRSRSSRTRGARPPCSRRAPAPSPGWRRTA